MFRDDGAPEPVGEPEAGRESPQGQTDHPFPVVAIGASAGGLEALSVLLHSLPADTGMAFVVIQHLAPTHESMLSQLLSRVTSMRVHQVADGAVLSPNQVYVIPPNAAMTISGLTLALKPRESSGSTVDGFLRSLAESRNSSSVAVILSGTGSDGSLGVQAIAEEGGVVFVQEPKSAGFDGMPRNAIATGCVDFVLPPEKIALELARIAREPRLFQPGPLEPSEEVAGAEVEFPEVCDLVRHRTGIDFNLYRQTTVRRRVLRRMAVLKQGSLGDYLEYLKENPDEAHALTQDILIRVTRFFRDPEVFDALSRRVFPALIRKTPRDQAARVWIAGCSTGEEAYSIGICFLEVAQQMQSRVPMQVFATDINNSAIEKARHGTYLDNIAADVSPERLSRFFTRQGREYQIGRKLRDLCIFSRHDLLNDPPFSRMGLVSCRNVLIYLDRMQERALSRFHFAVNAGGFLLLGKSESAASFPELFTPVDRGARLYVRQESAGNPARRRGKDAGAHGGSEVQIPQITPLRPRVDLFRQADRVITERYGPTRVIVNLNLDVIGYGGEKTGFFAPDARNDRILELAKHSQEAALKSAVLKASKTGQSVRIEPVVLDDGGIPKEISIEVSPLGPERLHCLVVFEERAAPADGVGLSGLPSSREGKRQVTTRVNRLEKELSSSRFHLESVITEQEAAHEEIVAANEELQSLNEELESSKEETEAANEELTTVNQELQVRNTELENAREFAQATIDTVRGALVVLGPDLRVLKANHSFYRMFGLSAQEVEHRLIYELGDGSWRIPQLHDLLERGLPGRRNMKDFEMKQEFPPGGERVLLLNAARFEREARILLSIEDVTASRHTEEELRQSQKMEAIGFLAAGVAHDFNNLLTAVIGNASLLLDDMPENDPRNSTIQSIISGGERAADLTRQLLAYAGKGRYYLSRVNLSEVVIQTSQLIHPSIPSHVELRLDLEKDLPLLLVDPGQIQQIVMNLLINATEAIGDQGGIVQVRTGRQTVRGEALPDLFLKEDPAPGNYVFIEVQDNGSGMDQETMQRIFDPFYTTKFTGRGLGLAAVLGIVRQYNGVIQLHSVVGRGTSFRILLSVDKKVPAAVTEDEQTDGLQGRGTVLVVDDEELIRNFTKSALEAHGYTVLLAQDGAEAIRVLGSQASSIDLVLLDVAMPGMDGVETLEQIRAIRADVPVLVCSGFGDTDLKERFAGKEVSGFFQKPYTVKQLAGKVKECLAPAGAAE